MEAIKTGHRRKFDDDENTRDVYQITLNRAGRSWSFEFGTSLTDSSLVQDSKGPFWDGIRRKIANGHSWLKEQRKYRGRSPSLYDVVACLTKCDPGSLANFCGEYGYDADSRKGLELYLAVQNEYEGFSRLLGSPEALTESQDIA